MDRIAYRSIGNAVLAVAVAGLVIMAACGPESGTAPTSSSPSTATTPPTPSPSMLRLVVLGDSIASGTPIGGQGVNGWPSIVAQKLGLLALLSAQPGTGYTKDYGAGYAYTVRVSAVIALRPNLLIVEGSRNDVDAAATKRAATSVLSQLHSALPQAKILVIGPLYLDKTGLRTTPINDAVKGAAASVGLTYIDTLKAGWFSGSAHAFVGSDGIHPTDEGHRYLASLIIPLVTQMLPAGYPMPTPISSP